MKYTFLNLAEEVLKNNDNPLSIKEIWKEAKRQSLDTKVGSLGKTPDATLAAKVYIDIRDNNNNTIFKKVTTRPTTFGLKYKNYGSNVNINNNISTQVKYKEKDLHPVLVKYVDSNQHFKCMAKTINQSTITINGRSPAKRANMWVYSDLIGIYFPYNDFESTSLETMKYLNENPFKIYSFEMKTRIDISNFKEYYFQAVSNSSWANEGYLVCDDLDNDADLLDELRILNSAHGIGLILLDKEHPEQSQIILNARYNEKLDIFMLNKLILQNKDVSEVFKCINDSCKLGKIVGNQIFDKVLSDEEYANYASQMFK